MARESTFNFVPESQLSSKDIGPDYRVNINSSSSIYFPREVVEIWDLDKKFFKFYADVSKKAIAWKTVDTALLSDLTGYRKLTINPNNKSGVLSIKKLLSSIGISLAGRSIKNIPVKTYKGTYLEDEVSYIIINEKNSQERRAYNKTDSSDSDTEGDEPDGESGPSAGNQRADRRREETLPDTQGGRPVGDQEE